jgi:succinate dehydrogenase / fumarate reductase cytochrome b subunit
VTEDVENWMTRHHFMLRRVHSLLGIIPVGFFLIEHMLTNSLAFLGPERYNAQVHWLHELDYLIWLEILFILLPLAFHGIYGVAVLWTAQNNAHKYPYLDNWRFLLQRYTGVIALLFVIVHLMHFRFADWFGGTPFVGTADPFGLTQSGFSLVLPGAVWYPIYLIGLVATIFHFCNGLVTFCITWGISISVASRKRLSVVATGVFAVLMIWGLLSLYALKTVSYTPPAQSDEATHAMVERAVLPFAPGS